MLGYHGGLPQIAFWTGGLSPVPRQTATVAGSIGAGRSRLCWEKPGDCRPEEYWFEPGRLVAPDSAKSGSKGLVA